MSSYTPSQQAISKKSRENHQVRVELAGFQWSKLKSVADCFWAVLFLVAQVIPFWWPHNGSNRTLGWNTFFHSFFLVASHMPPFLSWKKWSCPTMATNDPLENWPTFECVGCGWVPHLGLAKNREYMWISWNIHKIQNTKKEVPNSSRNFMESGAFFSTNFAPKSDKGLRLSARFGFGSGAFALGDSHLRDWSANIGGIWVQNLKSS